VTQQFATLHCAAIKLTALQKSNIHSSISITQRYH